MPSLFQNSQKLSRWITVIWSEVKYVPSQIITATVCIALLSPAVFWEREVVKEDVIAAKSGGIGRASPWSPWARQRVWAGAPTPPPALTSHNGIIRCLSHPRAPESLLLPLNPEDSQPLLLPIPTTLLNWFHGLLPWMSRYHKWSTNENTSQFHFCMYV